MADSVRNLADSVFSPTQQAMTVTVTNAGNTPDPELEPTPDPDPIPVPSGNNMITDYDEKEVTPVYYTLQGVRVENPEKGIYIVVRGNKTTKEVIR